MCELFVGAEEKLWVSHTRSLRIEKVSTSIRLEHFFWNILEEIAFRDDLSVSQLIGRLYSESIDNELNMNNFTSFLRVCCARYLDLINRGEIPKDLNTPLHTLDAPQILHQEKICFAERCKRFQERH